MKTKPKCETVRRWLKANLGKGCLAVLTGTDARALDAAVQIVELYAYSPGANVAAAFRGVVEQMQKSARYLAYHAIAHVLDWPDRDRFWTLAGIEPVAHAGTCAFEPGGAARI